MESLLTRVGDLFDDPDLQTLDARACLREEWDVLNLTPADWYVVRKAKMPTRSSSAEEKALWNVKCIMRHRKKTRRAIDRAELQAEDSREWGLMAFYDFDYCWIKRQALLAWARQEVIDEYVAKRNKRKFRRADRRKMRKLLAEDASREAEVDVKEPWRDLKDRIRGSDKVAAPEQIIGNLWGAWADCQSNISELLSREFHSTRDLEAILFAPSPPPSPPPPPDSVDDE